MLQTLTNPLSRWFIACAVLAAPIAFSSDSLAQVSDRVNDSFAQMPPGAPPPQVGQPPGQLPGPGATGNPICQRLEGQLRTIDGGAGSGDPAKDEQIRKYQEAQARQQGELDRVVTQAKRMGCDSSGFFSLFNQQSAQCGPVNNQIQQMRGNLDQITTNLERLRSGGLGGADRENQRRSVLTALAQNNCGPQYAAAARESQGGGPGGFLGGLFGNNVVVGKTGLFLNNGMRIGSTSPYPTDVNYVGAGKIPILNNSPVVVLKDGALRFVFGTPGGETIGQTEFQVLVRLVDEQLPVQEAIEAPRFVLEADPNFYKPGAAVEVRVEGRASADDIAAVIVSGHGITHSSNLLAALAERGIRCSSSIPPSASYPPGSSSQPPISGGHAADVVMVMAVTDPQKRARGGIGAFLVPRGTPGFEVSRARSLG